MSFPRLFKTWLLCSLTLIVGGNWLFLYVPMRPESYFVTALLLASPFVLFHLAYPWQRSLKEHRRLRVLNVFTLFLMLLLLIYPQESVRESIANVASGLLVHFLIFVFGLACFLTPFFLLAVVVTGTARGATATFHAVQGLKLMGHLQRRGHYWITQEDATRIYREIGGLAYKLPAFEEVGTVPSYQIGDYRSVIAVMVNWRSCKMEELIARDNLSREKELVAAGGTGHTTPSLSTSKMSGAAKAGK